MGSKRATHQALIQGLSQWAGNGGVVVLDSTNGDEGARALYVQTLCAKRILAVCFHPPEGGAEALVEGTDRRVAAEMSEGIFPSFPVDREDQIEKHRKILSGIQFPQQAGLACLPGVQVADVLEHQGSDEDIVRCLFRLIWCAVDPRVFQAGLR